MAGWREIFGMVGVDANFADVHERFRAMMTATNLDSERVLELAAALNEARMELGTSGRPPLGKPRP